jgi:hypothetical protein
MSALLEEVNANMQSFHTKAHHNRHHAEYTHSLKNSQAARVRLF